MSNDYRPRDRMSPQQRDRFDVLVALWIKDDPPTAGTSRARRILLCSELGFNEPEAYVWSTFDPESLRQAVVLTDAELESGGVLLRLINEQYSRQERQP